MPKSQAELEQIAKRVRREIVEMIGAAKSGHPGGSLSAVEILVELYFDYMRIDPRNPTWPDRDRFDLAVRALSSSWDVDVKDHADPITIVEGTPAARDIVVPDYRRAQLQPLTRAMPGKRVWTISGFVRHVRHLSKETG